LDGKTAPQNIRLHSGQTYSANVAASDPDHDPLTYRWEVMEESAETKIGGDAESKPAQVPGLIDAPQRNETSLRAPNKPGAYRLFAYVFDGKGHAAHANIPFYVENSAGNRQGTTPTASRPPTSSQN
jgi:hypothetical protein